MEMTFSELLSGEMTEAVLLPLIFTGIMGLAVLAYVVLDGYDLGVGILMARAEKHEQDAMIASIGPFWDANETWLVLGVGILLVAFPVAHGIILTSLYLPVAAMLAGLILRGVAFDFRAKAQDRHQKLWNHTFTAGSLLATMAQGFMLGMYIVGFHYSASNVGFALLCGLGLVAGYGLLGAGWLILKAEGALQKRAVHWSRVCLWLTVAGMALVSIATPLVNERIFHKWFHLPEILFLLPIPASAGALTLWLQWMLRRYPLPDDRYAWAPIVLSMAMFLLGFLGLAYSFFPYLVPDRLTLWQAAAATESLEVILIGVGIVVPAIMVYTFYAYRVFSGKLSELSYD